MNQANQAAHASTDTSTDVSRVGGGVGRWSWSHGIDKKKKKRDERWSGWWDGTNVSWPCRGCDGIKEVKRRCECDEEDWQVKLPARPQTNFNLD
jgi:hypothetical protein